MTCLWTGLSSIAVFMGRAEYCTCCGYALVWSSLYQAFDIKLYGTGQLVSKQCRPVLWTGPGHVGGPKGLFGVPGEGSRFFLHLTGIVSAFCSLQSKEVERTTKKTL